MTIYRSATLVPLVMHHKRARCATCSTRHSTHFDRWRRRSKFDATRPPGWTFSAISPVSTSKARNTAGRTTGPSGAGIASAPAKTNARASSEAPDRRSDHAHPNHPEHPPGLRLSAQMGCSAGQPVARRRAAHGGSARTPPDRRAQVDDHAVHVRTEPAVRRHAARVPRVQAARTSVVRGRGHPNQARGFNRSTRRRGGP
jgi:hypothetical protein